MFTKLVIGTDEISLTDSLEDAVYKLPRIIRALNGVKPTSIDNFRVLALYIIKKYEEATARSNSELTEILLQSHDDVVKLLRDICLSNRSEDKLSAYKTLIDLLPSQTILEKKVECFPNQHFAELIKVIIFNKTDLELYMGVLKNVLIYEDMSRNLWKALDIAICKLSENISQQEVENILQILNYIEKPKTRDVPEFGPVPYFCKVPGGVITDKEIGNCIKRFWERLTIVELSLKVKQSLLIALYEKLMPQMNKPIFLTDYFMNSLEIGGPVSLLALQGIFTLVQKYNINYPNVYSKIYTMLKAEIFSTQYKARFYYLADIFLSSSHLPEVLVAGFVKKFARLSLVAPATDIIIIIAFITNLMIRHPGLKKLIHNPKNITYECDPYNIDAVDPSLSSAIDSSLWEIQILQHHVLPSIANAALFINNPLPSVERDIAGLLEVTYEETFIKELKKKMKEPPLTFEKPVSMHVPSVKTGFNFWNFS